jgi:hypothetical protein
MTCPACGQSAHHWMRFEAAFGAAFDGLYGFLIWALRA